MLFILEMVEVVVYFQRVFLLFSAFFILFSSIKPTSRIKRKQIVERSHDKLVCDEVLHYLLKTTDERYGAESHLQES